MPGEFKIVDDDSAYHKQVLRLPPAIRKALDAAIEDLKIDPFAGSKEMRRPYLGRQVVRVAKDYRLIFRVQSNTKRIFLEKVAHRSSAYGDYFL